MVSAGHSRTRRSRQRGKNVREGIPKREEVRAGDIVEFESAIFADGVRTGPNHTAVVTVGGSDGLLTVAEQNFIGMKRVTTRPMNLNSRLYGRVTVYRPQ
jgi:hypothetical protein